MENCKGMMTIEEALNMLEGCLIEPILNPEHPNINKSRVIEVQSEDIPERVCGYAETFELAIIDAADKYIKLMKERKNGNV